MEASPGLIDTNAGAKETSSVPKQIVFFLSKKQLKNYKHLEKCASDLLYK